jgi:hypothetical protein
MYQKESALGKLRGEPRGTFRGKATAHPVISYGSFPPAFLWSGHLERERRYAASQVGQTLPHPRATDRYKELYNPGGNDLQLTMPASDTRRPGVAEPIRSCPDWCLFRKLTHNLPYRAEFVIYSG